MTTIVVGVLIFLVGALFGFGLEWWLKSRNSYYGVIVVSEAPERIIYTLELSGDPEQMMYEDKVIFKVDSSALSLNRE